MPFTQVLDGYDPGNVEALERLRLLYATIGLTGVVVNDSLVMVDFINRHREDSEGLLGAVRQAGGMRFRAILLTSLTTFVGLLPIIFETSLQAQLMIPTVISLAFGVLFATGVTLLLVPCLYLLGEQVFAHILHRRQSLPDAIDPQRKRFVLTPQGKAGLALFLLAATWWVFEVVPIGVTSITIGADGLGLISYFDAYFGHLKVAHLGIGVP